MYIRSTILIQGNRILVRKINTREHVSLQHPMLNTEKTNKQRDGQRFLHVHSLISVHRQFFVETLCIKEKRSSCQNLSRPRQGDFHSLFCFVCSFLFTPKCVGHGHWRRMSFLIILVNLYIFIRLRYTICFFFSPMVSFRRLAVHESCFSRSKPLV